MERKVGNKVYLWLICWQRIFLIYSPLFHSFWIIKNVLQLLQKVNHWGLIISRSQHRDNDQPDTTIGLIEVHLEATTMDSEIMSA